jgi:hypothetical protein
MFTRASECSGARTRTRSAAVASHLLIPCVPRYGVDGRCVPYDDGLGIYTDLGRVGTVRGREGDRHPLHRLPSQITKVTKSRVMGPGKLSTMKYVLHTRGSSRLPRFHV